MNKDFGKKIDNIGANGFILGLQALLGLIIAGVVVYFLLIRGLLSPDTTTLSPTLFNIIVYAVIACGAIWALVSILKIGRNRIELHETGLVIHGLFSTKEVPYDTIDHFDWLVSTSRVGFIPVSRAYYLHIAGKSVPIIATIGSDQYRMRKKMEALESKLGI